MAALRQVNAKEFARELGKGPLRRVYLFLGEEESLKEKMIDRVAGLMEKESGPGSVAVARFHAENNELDDAVGFALTQSMFSPKKLAVMYGTDSIQATKQNKSLLEDLVSGLPDATTLIMVSSQNNAPKIVPGDGDMVAVKFWRYFENDMAVHVRDTIRKYGMSIEEGAVSLLMKLLGRDLGKVDEALERLKFSGQTHITPGLVSLFIADDREASIFEFLDALFRKSAAAFNLLKTLLDDGVHELVILTMINRQCESLEAFHRRLGEGAETSGALEGLGVQERNRQAFLDYAGKFGPADIRRAFAALYEAESRLKGSPQSRSLVANPVFILVSRFVLPPGKGLEGIAV